ncbi:MAG: His/Gly/Thr/Pro-type tRNA ligase C-terminal domain-containing protein, partial [Defluviitaleaceae bacterium]|nr:His/Gly/Thr/Pro-type tRNA ligase C-terminal domain-containing protein [Defluviitaleaceae bacterium]
LIDAGLEFAEADGEAAFYGPKLDIQVKNVYGKEDTLITVQIDFLLAERFGMYYIDKDGAKKHPMIIHRSSVGCYERTLAMLIEKYAGALPLWLAPVQALVLPISDKFNEYAEGVVEKLKAAGIRAEGDFRAEKIGYKIREARGSRVQYIFVAGEKEQSDGTVAVRSRKLGEEGALFVDEIMKRMLDEIKRKEIVQNG